MTQYRDRDGDVWEENPEGGWSIVQSDNPVNIGVYSFTLTETHKLYGPLTELDPPNPEPTYVTRAELAEILRAVAHEVEEDGVTYLPSVLAEIIGDLQEPQ